MSSSFRIDGSNRAPCAVRSLLNERVDNDGDKREIHWTSEVEQLQDKLKMREGELQVAAQIGTTLLEKMRTLEEENERLQNERAKFFETCDRRTHDLDRKMTEYADEADGRIRELEAEVRELKKEKRNYQNTQQKLNHRIGSLEEENAQLLIELETASQQGASVRKERSDNEKQLKELKDELEKTKQIVRGAEAKASAITETNLELKHNLETVTNQREYLQQQLKIRDSQLLTAQLEVDEQQQQLEAERSVVAQLREACIHLKDEVEEKQAQESAIRTSSSDLSLMSELQECFVLSPVGDYHQVAEERDKLLERNSQLSCELSSVRNELQRVEELLMTAVRQKLELTIQLEEWQCDMTVLVEQQVAKELYKDKRPDQLRVR